jgi:hypothetical protein
MSQMYCRKCEAPLEYGATVTGLCRKCDPHAFVPPPVSAPDGSVCQPYPRSDLHRLNSDTVAPTENAELMIRYQEHSLDDVMAFWAEQYHAPVEHYEWFIDLRKQQAIFKLYVRGDAP